MVVPGRVQFASLLEDQINFESAPPRLCVKCRDLGSTGPVAIRVSLYLGT